MIRTEEPPHHAAMRRNTPEENQGIKLAKYRRFLREVHGISVQKLIRVGL